MFFAISDAARGWFEQSSFDPSAEEPGLTFYLVDRRNVVVEVGPDWDAIAGEAGGAPGALRAQVLGQPLLRFMVGDSTRMFVQAALDAARLGGRPRSLPYRCDSPSERRRFEMLIQPLEAGEVRVEHRWLGSEARRPGGLQAGLLQRVGWRCSQCLRVRLRGSPEWVELDGHAPLAQDLCGRCAAQLFEPASSGAG